MPPRGSRPGAGTVRSGPSSMRRATARRRAWVSSAGGRACAQADQQHVRRALQQRCAAQRLAEPDLTRYRLALGQPEPGLFEDGGGARPFGAGHGIRAGGSRLDALAGRHLNRERQAFRDHCCALWAACRSRCSNASVKLSSSWGVIPSARPSSRHEATAFSTSASIVFARSLLIRK